MMRPNFTFAQAQAAYDVISLAQRKDDETLTALGGRSLPQIVRERGCLFDGTDDLAVYERVAEAAMTPEDPQCALALAILLADTLQTGVTHRTLYGYAEIALPAIRSAPRVLRAAIVRAFNVAHVPEQPGFVYCTALLFLDAVRTDDRMWEVGFRFQRISDAYRGLHDVDRVPMFAVIRHLYETGELDAQIRHVDPILTPNRLIPLIDFPAATS